ncbi:MAG: HAD-IA family hydrolase [Bryobacteraceae bacterium]
MTFRCDAVLFDMDGTLVDSRIACDNLLRSWATRHGLDAELISASAHGRTNRDIAREFTPHLIADEEGARLDEEELLYREGNVAVPGAVHIIAALPLGSWALVTSASRRVAEMRLECADLPAPAVLVSSDDVRRGKPDPEGYLMAAERLGVAPERCLVVEDTPTGLEAARRAGMDVLGITTTFQASELAAATCIADFTAVQVGQTEGSGTPRLELRVSAHRS